MKKFVVAGLVVLSLVGCAPYEKKEYVEPKISIGVEKHVGPSDIEQEEQREIADATAAKEAEALRLAEEKRVADEKAKAEQQRIADLEAENQLQQKRAEEARIAEIERQQAEAAKQLAERLEREKRLAPPPAPPAPSTGYQWITDMQNKYGVFAAPGTQIIISATNPCGGNAVGCTNYTKYSDGTTANMKLYIAPSEVGSDPWILFHEIGHTQGITDECQADLFARKYLPGHAGAYC